MTRDGPHYSQAGATHPAAFAAGVNDGVFLNLLTAACRVLVLGVTLNGCVDLEPAGQSAEATA